jgi:WD40 repeat protein
VPTASSTLRIPTPNSISLLSVAHSRAQSLSAMSSDASIAVELEHAIGFSGSVPGALQVLAPPPAAAAAAAPHYGGRGAPVPAPPVPASDRFVAAVGACAVVNSMTDPHSQTFLRGHRGNISVMALGNTAGGGNGAGAGASSSSAGRPLLATGERGFDSDVVVWDLTAGTVLHRFQEHDHGITSLAFSHDDRLLLSVGAAADGHFIVWDLATGGVLTRQRHDPSPMAVACFGGFARELKGRDTGLYLFATGGSKGLSLWTLDPITGACARERIAQPVASSLARDYVSLAFSPCRSWLYAGSASGDVVLVHVKSQAVYHSTFASGGGVTAILALASTTSGVGAGAGAGGMGGTYGGGGGGGAAFGRYGGAVSNAAASVDVYTAGGDGTLTVWSHATGTIDAESILSAPVSASHTSAVARPLLPARTFTATRSIKLDGPVWALSFFQYPNSATGAPFGILAGTSAGTLFRVYPAAEMGSPSRITTLSAGRPAGGAGSGAVAPGPAVIEPGGRGLAAAVFRQAHSAAGDPLDPSMASSMAVVASAGAPSLPAPLVLAAGGVGAVVDVAFAPGINDRFTTVAADNTVRVWDLTEYACASVTHVRSAGHPSCTSYAGEFHLSGWEDGGLRVYYADPTAVTAAVGGTRDFAASYHTAGGTALQMPGAHGVPGAASTATGQAGGFSGSPGRHKRSGREDAGYLWSIPDAHS